MGGAFPCDFTEIVGAYGDVVICEYLLLCGGRSLRLKVTSCSSSTGVVAAGRCMAQTARRPPGV